MKSKGILILVVVLAQFILPHSVFAEKTAGNSAVLASSNLSPTIDKMKKETEYILKRKAIIAVLERNNSPLVDSADAFIEACRTYDLDCYLLPAITGLESGYGKHILQGTYNGFGWGNGRIQFESWDDGIDTVGKGLRNNYINKGAKTIEQIGSIYAASPTWAIRVRKFMQTFQDEEDKNNLFFSTDSVKL